MTALNPKPEPKPAKSGEAGLLNKRGSSLWSQGSSFSDGGACDAVVALLRSGIGALAD